MLNSDKGLLVRTIVGSRMLEHSTTEFGQFCGGFSTACKLICSYAKEGRPLPTANELNAMHAEAVVSQKTDIVILMEAVWKSIYGLYLEWKRKIVEDEVNRPQEFTQFQAALTAILRDFHD